jgi:membrane protein DedA with SNARE-associated domain
MFIALLGPGPGSAGVLACYLTYTSARGSQTAGETPALPGNIALSMETFLTNYGLIAVFISSMIEADVVPVLTGVIAHLGYVGFLQSISVAAAGAFAGDCIWYVIGYERSDWIRSKNFYSRARKVVLGLNGQLGVWQIPASHVIYGTRIATMLFAGIEKTSFVKFATVDLLGCAGFTALLASLGFWFSGSALLIIGRVKRVEVFLLLVAIGTAIVFHLVKVVAQRQTQSS